MCGWEEQAQTQTQTQKSPGSNLLYVRDDGSFRLSPISGRVETPSIRITDNEIQIGCFAITREAYEKLHAMVRGR